MIHARQTCRVLLPAALVALLLACAGCETAQQTWQETKVLYKEYVDTNPMIDLESEVDASDADRKLARLITPVDVRVESLARYLDAQDAYPADEWVQRLFASYPWLSGLVVTDTEGHILLKKTLVPLKPLDVAPFLAIRPAPPEDGDKTAEGEQPPVWMDRAMRARYEITPLGPEIYVAQPFFKENKWAGLIVVHFDLGPLLKFCPDPEELLILTTGDVIWPGKYDRKSITMADAPLDEIVRGGVTGEWEDDQDVEYRWLARYLGDMRLIYAVRLP
ncbi:MAG: hypothetical protein H0S85_08550 [Desulfovibrionaceae bacterium]|jgi:hypothetical protein|nr:hypothetical protein [Desulfovibrionaceae bacterium]